MAPHRRNHIIPENKEQIEEIVIAKISDVFDVDLTTDAARREFRAKFRVVDFFACVTLRVFRRSAHIIVVTIVIAVISTVSVPGTIEFLRSVLMGG